MAQGESSSILEEMQQQWASMAGMAGMFVGTILLGLSIQPVYDIPEARAFGEEGAAKVGNVVLEMFFILVFTVVIIWLARRGLDFAIKAIVMFALWFSMFYALQPYSALFWWLIGIESVYLVVSSTVVISTALMVLLHRYPEWYVVNGVGILVGAGVVTIIGISFVPVLIILFMVIAAVYDHWAVNKSKHMLELADTMIGLKLPVLLVAPKSSSYTFLDQEGDVMDRSAKLDDPSNGVQKTETKKPGPKGRDALFMGLGDVIFPGMLVISSITFLPDYGPVVFDFWGEPRKPVHLGARLVGMGTLLGGLFGYAALMTQVARGKPQAGLPLLNGGSILGYLIS